MGTGFLRVWGQKRGRPLMGQVPVLRPNHSRGLGLYLPPSDHLAPDKTNICCVAFLWALHPSLLCLCPAQGRGLLAEVRGLTKDFSRVPLPCLGLARQGIAASKEREPEGRIVGAEPG